MAQGAFLELCVYVLAFSVSPTYKIQESCRLKALVSTLCCSFIRILKWDHFYLISHYSSQHNHPSLPSINVTLARYHSLSAYFFSQPECIAMSKKSIMFLVLSYTCFWECNDRYQFCYVPMLLLCLQQI